jgi:plasmid stabilization system protein ParE
MWHIVPPSQVDRTQAHCGWFIGLGNLARIQQVRLQGPREVAMPRGEKSKYTDKQERKADHIAESYEERGVGKKEAERRAWATVNKDDAGGKNPGGSGRGKRTGHPAAHKGGRLGGKAAASRPAAARSASARKAAATRKRRGH